MDLHTGVNEDTTALMGADCTWVTAALSPMMTSLMMGGPVSTVTCHICYPTRLPCVMALSRSLRGLPFWRNDSSD